MKKVWILLASLTLPMIGGADTTDSVSSMPTVVTVTVTTANGTVTSQTPPAPAGAIPPAGK